MVLGRTVDADKDIARSRVVAMRFVQMPGVISFPFSLL